jgi:ABC-2 type transport system permease protein
MQREYMSIVAKKSFLISTILAPVIMVLVGFIPVLLMTINKTDTRLVTIVDQSGKYGKMIEDDDEYHFEVLDNVSEKDIKQEFNDADGDIYAILVIPADVETSHTVNIYSDRTVNMSLTHLVENSISDQLSEAKIESYGIPELKQMISDCEVDVDVKSHTWKEDGESMSSSEIAMIVGMFLAFLTYIFVLMYGSMIMSSVVEDKTNRIVEVIVSTCKPMELMLGKIVSIALVGLTQIAIWVVFGSIVLGGLSAFGLSAMTDGVATGSGAVATELSDTAEIIQAVLSVNWLQLLVTFLFYFIGGYLLFGSIFAAFGSAVDQQSDANQFMTPVMMIIITALIIGQTCMESPDGTLAVVCSFIPFTSSIVMMIRLPYDVPFWEVACSLALLYATAFLMTYLASRIYRTGILMYGRKVTYKDLLKWLK